MSENNYVSIDEMIKETKDQLKLLEELKTIEQMNKQDIYNNRYKILNTLDKLYAYRSIEEGYAILDPALNPITPIRKKIFNISLELLSDKLNKNFENDLFFSVEKEHFSQKGYLKLMVRHRKDNINGEVIAGRVSIYTNEFQIYDYSEKINEIKNKLDANSENNYNKKTIETYQKQKELIEDLLDSDKSIKELVNLLLSTEKKLRQNIGVYFEPSLHAKLSAYYTIWKIKKDNKARRELVSLLSKVDNSIMYYENSLEEELSYYRNVSKTYKVLLKNYKELKSFFTNEGYTENTEKYFAYD